MLTGAEAVARLLRKAGVRRAYGVPGQRVLPLFAALAEENVPVVVTRHEQGASFMADVYARLGGMGCIVTTSGPGGINALAGVASAFMDSVPLIVLTAQAEVAEFGRYGIQEGSGLGRTPDVRQIFAATTKASFQPRTVDKLVDAVAEALALAVRGRPGPVHIDVPSDLLTDKVAAGLVEELAAGAPAPAAVPEPAAELIREVAGRIRSAKSPLLLIGNGVVRGGAVTAAQQVARHGSMWIAHSFLAKGAFDETNAAVLGPVGVFGTEAANRALHDEADLVVAVGVAFSYLTTSGWPARLGGGRLIRCDLDQRELGTNYTDGVNIHADARVFLESLATELATSDEGNAPLGPDLKARYPDLRAPEESAALHPIRVCDVVGEWIAENTTVVADVGQNAYWVERHLKTRGGGRFIINGGLGAMGHGVAGCLGAWHAGQDAGRPGPVLCTTGDGGFMMGALEVSTAVSEGADVTWIIFNNGTLGTQKEWYVRQGASGSEMDLPDTDYVALASAMGARAFRATTEEELREALGSAGAHSGPTVIDVVIDPVPAPTVFGS
ncbi:thiamine pyrophosphate-binding protein [Actinoplanes sp. NEAU-A12]|uniref:Thiamine pyrophosphate-binding protein n=1 Tax=Actinoplanes sandaracinus TaxID=3045177 RepID=A0ABT6WX36_9ACTN|nr:thiamine pyrophosphate-binding protein [Actinoplanes sandaracinus]MDI6104306.1 thiamine pyrophosphate-binding protein [Actinoplanes sandaracinus]